jgi:type II secretory ATPase GspE/PulE/Tfp pilus assembly ATPase PilB-like protein
MRRFKFTKVRGWRWAHSLGVAGLLILLCGSLSYGQGNWPEYSFPSPQTISRGPGGYLSWVKLLMLWLIFLAWVKTTDWASRDMQQSGMPYAIWTPIVFFPSFLAILGLGLNLPIFAASLTLCLLTYLGSILTYVFVRNQRMELHERVLTPSHLRHLFALLMARLGVKISSEKKAAHEKGAPVLFTAQGAKDPQLDQANLVTARQSKAFLPTKELVANAVDHRAEKIMLDFTQQGASTRFLVDGVWHDSENRDRDEGDAILAVLKTLAALKPEERRSRQQGKFKLEYKGKKLGCAIVSQGTQTGERVLCSLFEQKISFKSLIELGMREKMVERLKELMLTDHGLLLFSSMPSGGLSTSLNIALRSTDRLLRDFIVVEDVADMLESIENVDPVTYDAAAGQTPDAILDTVLRKQPDVLVLPQLPNAATVIRACQAAEEDQLVFATIRAKEAVEALLRILLLKAPAKVVAPVLLGVLNQRLVRLLCTNCREEYPPPPVLLSKLGIPQGRVEKLYRHPENPEKECPICHGIGYLGRTGIFELLIVEDSLREALLTQPKLEVLRAVARKAGHTTLQEEGLAKVVQGLTSLEELMRVLKQ